MPKGSEALTQARREEIIDACAKLYETMGFKDVTIKEIGKVTSFTRTSIYNYFQTKEEIFLALIGREFSRWGEALAAAQAACPVPDRAQVAEILADTLSERVLLLKILSMNMFEIEEKSSLEQLIGFKKAFCGTVDQLERMLAQMTPPLDADGRKAFLYSFLPFMYGIYPYTATTEKQYKAMEANGFTAPALTPHGMILETASKLLAVDPAQDQRRKP